MEKYLNILHLPVKQDLFVNLGLNILKCDDYRLDFIGLSFIEYLVNAGHLSGFYS